VAAERGVRVRNSEGRRDVHPLFRTPSLSPPAVERPEVTGAALTRAALFFGFWLAISGWKAADLPVGLAAIAGATWTSLALLPPQGARVRFGALIALAVSFVRGSVAGGFDVARRALRPDLDLRPGLVTAPLRLPPGNARNAFSALASLMPGTLPVGMDEDSLLVHGLDVAQPIAEDLAREETLFMRALGDE
jgi:multicomponent Na+:H+ antiporter subunit E